MLNLREKITEKEFEYMNNYRDQYAYTDETYTGNRKDIREILATWEINKQTLYKLFGEKLMLSKEIEYTKSIDQIIGDMDVDWCNTSTAFGKFVSNFHDWIDENYISCWSDRYYSDPKFKNFTQEEKEKNYRTRSYLYDLMGLYYVAKNEYMSESFEIPTPDGKEIKVNRGCKALKVIGKIASAFGIEGFEEFRIAHSMYLNQKKISGTLHISIHPFDYMTMSDNDYDWESCMSWRNDGGYKAGTVEMMNSENIIVAYIAPNNRNIRGYNDSYVWNDKKWRELFIVSEDAIVGVKDYPYCNEIIANEVINWLKELAETNMGWKYANETPYDMNKLWKNHDKTDKILDDYAIKNIMFEAGYMYNDMGRGDYHPIFIGENIINSPITFYIDMSGPSQCMCCGDTEINIEDESRLCCSSCDGSEAYYCYDCGDRIDFDYAYEVDGEYYCEHCYENLDSCDRCEEKHLNLYSVVPVPMEIANNLDKENNTKRYAIDMDKLMSLELDKVCVDCFYEKNNRDFNINGYKTYWWDNIRNIFIPYDSEYFKNNPINLDEEEVKELNECFKEISVDGNNNFYGRDLDRPSHHMYI